MRPGDVVGGRFELERLAGSGGMSEVFRARDRVTGDLAAVKVLLEGHVDDEGRFEQEAQILAEMSHPGLVRYVAHGAMPSGARYLAMEWLEGEDLARRLVRQRLSVEECATLAIRVGGALGAVHARGIVHRDLKPSNIFLVRSDVEGARILDFGVARFGGLKASTTRGSMLGTLGYMAPEQARSGQALTARADVFALGCVLHECLAGVPAFAGEHVMAVLAKILFEDTPRVRDLRPDVPEALGDLIGRMLAKDPWKRPRDGAAVAEAFASLGQLSSTGGEGPPSPPVPSLTRGEQRLLSVVLVGDSLAAATARARGEHATHDDLRREAEARGGRLELLAEGSVAVTIAGATQIATDQAAQAARCAIALRALVPERPIALGTGRVEVTGRLPVGEAIDRAARVLARRGLFPESAGSGGRLPPIAIDDVTAGLLDARFEVARGPGGLELHGERAHDSGARTLLGKETPYVGRDRELSTLTAFFAECVDGPTAHAVLVTAPAGMGKSRLQHELCRALRQRGEPVEIWSGRGDSLRKGSAFGLLGGALRSACGILDGEPLEDRREKLRARVARHVAPSERARVAEFLGELAGSPFPDDASAPLRAARQDALLMGEQMRAAWEDFLRAEASAQPVLLVLEDLHWGDLPTVRFVDAAMRSVKDLPWMVLALARPEVHELFPKLWSGRGMQEIRLKELTRRAGERLVRLVLGDAAPDSTALRLVTQADGNALYLEELIRAVAEGRGDTLPDTVVAMVEARLEGLEAEARRVLRAASVFGEVFWQEGVVALLGGALRSTQTANWLNTLAEREILVHRPASRFPGAREYAFRHALLREGAYAMLTDADRALGHRLAAEWLERSGESDPMALAEHYARGDDPSRAGGFYLRAAELAQRGGDNEAAIARAERGLDGGAPGEVRVNLLSVLCESRSWRGEWLAAGAHAEEIFRIGAPGSVSWTRAGTAMLGGAFHRGAIDVFLSTLDLLQRADPLPDAVSAAAFALAMGIVILDSKARFDRSSTVRRRLRAIVEPVADRDPVARGWMLMADTHREPWIHEDPWSGLRTSEAAHASFQEARHGRGLLISQVFVGVNAWHLGALDRAERELRATMGADDTGLLSSRGFYFVEVLVDRGALDEAEAEASRMIEGGRARKLSLHEGRGRWGLAEVLRRRGDLARAEQEMRAALDLLRIAPLDRTAATATLAAVQLARGDARALATAEAAMEAYGSLRAHGYRGSFARLVYAEALRAAGDRAGSHDAIRWARDRLVKLAERVGDPDLRRSYLEGVPEHARTFELAREWLASGER